MERTSPRLRDERDNLRERNRWACRRVDKPAKAGRERDIAVGGSARRRHPAVADAYAVAADDVAADAYAVAADAVAADARSVDIADGSNFNADDAADGRKTDLNADCALRGRVSD